METTYIEIDSPDKHLSDVLEEIPSNVILYKTLTGIGATYSEIKAQRHSIIIEPNVPVIIGKCNSANIRMTICWVSMRVSLLTGLSNI